MDHTESDRWSGNWVGMHLALVQESKSSGQDSRQSGDGYSQVE
jgi:hypothetical protein